jgi:hypothetical protein
MLFIIKALIVSTNTKVSSFMGKFYTDEQIREAIAALETNSPGIWERMKKLASNSAPPDEYHEITLTAVTRVADNTYLKLPFIAQAGDKNIAIHKLSIDVGNTLRSEIAAAKQELQSEKD